MEPARFSQAVDEFDRYNANDPNRLVWQGRQTTKELLYAQRMSDRLAKFYRNASESLQLAARCQHIGRWEIPRSSYPLTRKGYLQWRSGLKMHHANIAEKILTSCGYDMTTIQRVRDLVLKKGLQTDAECQVLEDVVCLVFVEHYLAEFSAQHEEEKVVDIIRKTLKKMSAACQTAVVELGVAPHLLDLIRRATNAPGLFQFEREFMEGSLPCVPMVVRFQLDAAGIKLKLDEWNAFTSAERLELTEWTQSIVQFKTRVEQLIATHTGNAPTTQAIEKQPAWAVQDEVHTSVVEQAQSFGWIIPLEIWRDLTDLQRFALLKLSRPGHANKNFAKAMKEFGLAEGEES